MGDSIFAVEWMDGRGLTAYGRGGLWGTATSLLFRLDAASDPMADLFTRIVSWVICLLWIRARLLSSHLPSPECSSINARRRPVSSPVRSTPGGPYPGAAGLVSTAHTAHATRDRRSAGPRASVPPAVAGRPLGLPERGTGRSWRLGLQWAGRGDPPTNIDRVNVSGSDQLKRRAALGRARGVSKESHFCEGISPEQSSVSVVIGICNGIQPLERSQGFCQVLKPPTIKAEPEQSRPTRHQNASLAVGVAC